MQTLLLIQLDLVVKAIRLPILQKERDGHSLSEMIEL